MLGRLDLALDRPGVALERAFECAQTAEARDLRKQTEPTAFGVHTSALCCASDEVPETASSVMKLNMTVPTD